MYIWDNVYVPSSYEFFIDENTINNGSDVTDANCISIGKRYDPAVGYVININYAHELKCLSEVNIIVTHSPLP